MPTITTPTTIDAYANKDQHVDMNIAGNDFTNSAHVIVYAAVHSAKDASTTFTAIGVIQGWSFTEQKQVEELFELGSDVRYIVPGRTTGQIAVTRMLINGKDLINTLYGSSTDDVALRSLKDINQSIDLMFVTYHNSDTVDANKTHMNRYFDNCWITARQESITANQVVIAENCTITYEKIAHLSTDLGGKLVTSDAV